MRTLNKLLTISAIAFLFMLMAPHKSMAQDGGYVSDQEFYDNLQDYGTWVYDEQLGNVWVPDVDGDFRPYATNGYWVQTDYGTTWVSDYPWGWATFHYGRWRYDDYYGWEWIPGHEWAPAWVSWRQGGGYYSWAPMQPGISINISFGGGYHVPDNYWVCAPQAYITSRYINKYYAPPTRVTYIIRNTTYIHNTYVYNHNTYITGPRARDIEHITRRPVTIYKIGNADRPGAARFGNRSINFYRPVVRVNGNARPVRVVDAHAYRKQHPNDGIGKAGVTVNVHVNAAKLAAVARSNKPDNKVVRINPAAPPVHPGISGGHHNVGPVTPSPAPAADNKHPRKVAPAVMPPADHHDPTIRQPANNQAAEQQKQQAQQAEEEKKQQAEQQKQQAEEQKKQQQQQAEQQKQQAQQAEAQKKQQQQQAEQQKKVQAQQAAQQQKQQQQQAAQQAKQQAQEQQKQQQQQAQQAAKQQAQQQKMQQQQAAQQAKQQAQQQKIQQQQAAQQAKQQAQQQQKLQQQQAQQVAKQQAQQQQKLQQQQAQQAAKQQQQAAQKAAKDAAKKQQEDQQKQQNPPGN